MRDVPWCRLCLVSGKRAIWDFWRCFSVFSVIAGRRVTVPGESSEVIRRNIIEVLFCWWPPHSRRSLLPWDAKRVSDFEDLPFIGEESDDAHGPLAAGTHKRVNLKDAFYACNPAHGRCSCVANSSGTEACFARSPRVLQEYQIIDRRGPDWRAVFAEFDSARKVDTDAIADLAIDNFVEMRDTSAHPKFILKKHVEHALEDAFPDFISKYSMVTFHRLPYSVAMQKGRIQDRIVMEACEKVSSLDQVDLKELHRQIAVGLRAAGL